MDEIMQLKYDTQIESPLFSTRPTDENLPAKLTALADVQSVLLLAFL